MKNHFCLNLFFLLYLFFCAGCKQHISDSAAKANEALFTQLDSLIDNSDKLILQKEERIGEPEELAGITVYLASDASSFTQGSVFNIDGGYSAL